MSGILLNIAIPEYYGEYEDAMRRLVEICQDEAQIFRFFFKQELSPEEIFRFSQTLVNLTHPDQIYALYHGSKIVAETNPVKDVGRDLITVLNHLQRFYRSVPFVQRLIDQAKYLNRKIDVISIFPFGLQISIV